MAKKTKTFLTSDKIFGLTAMLISLVTLIIFVRQTNIMDKQSRLSAMPYLMFETSANGYDSEFILELVNHGVGPAIIDGKSIFFNDENFEMEFHDFLTSQFKSQGMDTINIMSNSSVYRGLAIPSGGERTLLKVGGTKEDYRAFMHFFYNIQNKTESPINFEIRYSSIYGDKWSISSMDEIPKEIK